MKFKEKKALLCSYCRKIFNDDQIMIAENPFKKCNTITGCPNCKIILCGKNPDRLCDEKYCKDFYRFALNINGKVRYLCERHYEKVKK